MTYEEFKKNLWNQLNLDNRSIIFHTLDLDRRYTTYIGSGLVESTDDLYESGPFLDECFELCDESEIYVENVTSYLLGNGEADHADHGDVKLLQHYVEQYGNYFDQLLNEEADVLCSLNDVSAENPEYEEPDEDCDYDNEEE